MTILDVPNDFLSDQSVASSDSPLSQEFDLRESCPESLREFLDQKYDNNPTALQESFKKHVEDITLYSELMRKFSLSEQETDRLEEILEKASHNNILSFWLSFADERILENQGLWTDSAKERYAAQQLKLRKIVKCENSCECSSVEVD